MCSTNGEIVREDGRLCPFDGDLVEIIKTYIILRKAFSCLRNYDGTWIDLDDNSRHGLTEGSKWTYLFCVLQDIPGMIDLMGGPQAFSDKLDRNFEEDHYKHDNEPGHHYIYLYNYCNEPWKTQELVRKHVKAEL